MHTFQVWGPRARTVEVKIASQRFPLQRDDRNWWSATVESAGEGTDYFFVVNGEDPAVPDPRSLWQPDGVHGASRIADLSAFRWTDAGWQAPPLTGAVFYELHIGTFTPEGTLDAAESRLDDLRDLGITHIELMPVATFPGEWGWGYDGVDLYAPHPVYGGPAGLQHFVNACHAKGLAVLLDVVYNHFGPVGNYLAKFGPYTTESHCTPWGGAINLEEAGSDEVRRFFIDNALMWLRDYHFDGLRLDAVHSLIDRSAIHFLEQLAGEVRLLSSQLAKNFVVIAESDLNDPRLVRAEEAGGFGLDAQWSDDFHHAIFSALTGERQGYYEDFGSLADIAKALEEVFVYNGNYSVFRRRHHGRPATGVPGHRFLGYAQNHDQIGNQAKGERITHLVSLGRAKIAAALVFTSPFVPLIFQGEEFAASSPFLYFTNFQDPEIGRLVSEGRKREFAGFGWREEEFPDPQDPRSFQQSKLDWQERDQPPHSEMRDWYKSLIRLRHAFSDLAADTPAAVRVRFDEQQKWLVVERGRLRIACNFGSEPAALEIGAGELLLASGSVALNGNRVELPQDAVAIVALRSS